MVSGYCIRQSNAKEPHLEAECRNLGFAVSKQAVLVTAAEKPP